MRKHCRGTAKLACLTTQNTSCSRLFLLVIAGEMIYRLIDKGKAKTEETAKLVILSAKKSSFVRLFIYFHYRNNHYLAGKNNLYLSGLSSHTQNPHSINANPILTRITRRPVTTINLTHRGWHLNPAIPISKGQIEE